MQKSGKICRQCRKFPKLFINPADFIIQFYFRLKEYVKRQKLADIKAEKEQKKLLKDRAKMDIETINENNILPHRPSLLTFKGRIKPSQTFSDIVGTISTNATARRRGSSAVCRKALAKKAITDDFKVVEVILNNKINN